MILKAGKPDSKVKVSYSPIFIITVKNDKFLYLDDTSDEYKCVYILKNDAPCFGLNPPPSLKA